MLTFDPEVHTPEALGSEIGRIHSDYDSARLGGSLGRAIIYGLVLGNPDYEYQQRNQNPLHTGPNARDIDLIGAEPVDPVGYGPFQVDTTGFVCRFLSLEEQAGDWYLTAAHHGFAEPLHEDVVRPIQGETTLGITATTLPAQTLLALYGNKGQMRAKDNYTKNLLQEVCDKLPPEEQLKNELFKPFQTLTLLNQASLYIRAQDLYRQRVPISLRTKLIPLLHRAKKHIH